jgi:hypothetical protein
MWKEAVVADFKRLQASAWKDLGKPLNTSVRMTSGRYLNPGPPEYEAGSVNHSTTTFGKSTVNSDKDK